MKIQTYRDLIVWQKSIDLVVEVYKLTDKFPRSELYTLTSQIRRSATSIPSNIAEGRSRGSRKDFRQFMIVAYSSGAELETQLEIVKRLNYCNETELQIITSLLLEIMKMLNKMIASLNS